MKDDVIFEEQTIRNKGLENVLEKTLDFNIKYLEFLESKLKEMKEQRDKLING